MPQFTASVPRLRPVPALAAIAAVAALLVPTAGCGASDSPSRAEPARSTASAASGPVSVRDAWVKAAESGMTGAFGTLVNEGDSDVTVVGAASPVSPVELHEMTMRDGKMVMQPKAGGFVIPAKSTHVLEPGGDHLMLMKLAKPVRPGDEVTVTLTFADGTTSRFTAVAKPFTGAGESYAPGHGTSTSPAA